MKKSRIQIQHAQNGSEFRILTKSGRTLKADGYNKRLNIVFEFYGDAFHGNPKVHKPHSKPHPFSEEKAKHLHAYTKQREHELRLNGYKLITCWENEYKKDKHKCISKALKRIQQIKLRKQ